MKEYSYRSWASNFCVNKEWWSGSSASVACWTPHRGDAPTCYCDIRDLYVYLLDRYPDFFLHLYFTTQSVDHIYIVMEYVPVSSLPTQSVWFSWSVCVPGRGLLEAAWGCWEWSFQLRRGLAPHFEFNISNQVLYPNVVICMLQCVL